MTSHSKNHPQAGPQKAPFSRRSILKYMASAAAACPTCLSVASAMASGKEVASAAHGAANSAAKAGHGSTNWTYGGDTGPQHWGDLKAGNKVCSMGFQQSPIDLRAAIPASPGTIKVDYKPTKLHVVNNGHTIQCNTDPGSTMMQDGEKFRLVQFHFHHPSEHVMDGRRFDMECHFVHVNDAGMLAVLGVFIEPGGENNVLAPVWRHMPTSTGEKKVNSVHIDPARLLPANRQYFRYLGSLTTPPCSEKVIWSVFSQPVQASTGQVSQFAGLFDMNARPLQGLHRRLLLKSG